VALQLHLGPRFLGPIHGVLAIEDGVLAGDDILGLRPQDLPQRRHVELLRRCYERLGGCLGRRERLSGNDGSLCLLHPSTGCDAECDDRECGGEAETRRDAAQHAHDLDREWVTHGHYRRRPPPPPRDPPLDPPKLDAPRELLERALLPLHPLDPPPKPPEPEPPPTLRLPIDSPPPLRPPAPPAERSLVPADGRLEPPAPPAERSLVPADGRLEPPAPPAPFRPPAPPAPRSLVPA